MSYGMHHPVLKRAVKRALKKGAGSAKMEKAGQDKIAGEHNTYKAPAKVC